MSEERDDEARREEPRREGRGPRLRGLARRILGEGDEEREAASEDVPPEEQERARREARAILSSLWETGDKARMEIVRLIAREVRGYLEAMELHKDLNHLITNYSLEVHASFHLKPLPDAVKAAPSEPGVRAGLKPKPREGEAAEDD